MCLDKAIMALMQSSAQRDIGDRGAGDMHNIQEFVNRFGHDSALRVLDQNVSPNHRMGSVGAYQSTPGYHDRYPGGAPQPGSLDSRLAPNHRTFRPKETR